jgi:uncharacterized cysteine cluster protein YcgN (CxxCxxCC family)
MEKKKTPVYLKRNMCPIFDIFTTECAEISKRFYCAENCLAGGKKNMYIRVKNEKKTPHIAL